MPTSRFRDFRWTANLSVADAAKLLRVSERTIHNWEAGRVRIPYAAYKLLRIVRGGQFAHPAWRGTEGEQPRPAPAFSAVSPCRTAAGCRRRPP